MNVRLFAVLFILPLFSFTFVSSVRADYPTAQKDYVYQFNQYRTINDSFQVARSTYQTYRTLTSQNEAINQFRKVLQARNTVISSYYNLLQEKINITPGISSEKIKTFSDIKKSENTWLTDYQKRIDAAASIEDLNNVASEFENRYPQMNFETKQIIGLILLTKEANLKTEVDNTVASLSAQLTFFRQDGTDTSIWDRYFLITKNKLDLFDQKYAGANVIFNPKDVNSPIDIFSGQQRLGEANLYLRETLINILEIIRSITGQA